jgi:tetratricopeptide (TPR) repeat protein
MECRQLSSRGVSAIQRRDYATAEALLAQAVETCGVDAEARRQYATVLWHRGERNAALAQMDRAIELAGDDPALLVCRAQWHLVMHDLPAAQADAEAALDADPYAVAAWLLKARLARHASDVEQALADYHRVLALEPTHREALKEKAELHWGLSGAPGEESHPQLQRALMTVQVLLDTYPPSEEPAEALLLAGRIHSRLGRHGDAVRTLTAAAHCGPPSADALSCLAEAQLLAGRSEEAVTTARQALALAPQSRASHDLLQRAQLARNAPPPRW